MPHFEQDEPEEYSSNEGGSESVSSEEFSSDEEVEEVAAENEIDGDFDRLIQGIRSQDDGGGSLAKDWDLNFAAEREAEFKDDLREASGVGRKRRKKGRATGPILSQQVKALIGDGNQAYIDSNIPDAIRLMNEVIRIEPRAASAWSVLAQCYEDIGETQTALKLRVMASHLRHDADEWERLARQSRELGYNQQALYCYRKVNSLDPENLDAYWDRASLAKEMGDLRTAKNAFLAILKRFPHDMTVLREVHPILVELNDLGMCAQLLQQAFDHDQQSRYTGESFSNFDILLLADLYNALGEHERAVDVIRKGIRWLQGREDQRYWDLCEDDREYDPPGLAPRETGPIEAGHFALDTNARHRLAVARIKMGDAEEGKRHANAILAEDVLDYAVLFSEIADAYFEQELWAEAKPIYELLGGDPATSSIYVLLQTAACMRNLEQLKEAAEVYEHIRLADPSHNDAKMKLAEIYEILGETRRALDLVYEVIDSRKKRKGGGIQGQPSSEASGSQGPGGSTSLFAEEKVVAKSKAAAARAQNRLTHAQLRELEAEKEREVVRGFKRLKEVWAAMLKDQDGDEGREWMMEAEKLVDMFRETRNLFLTSRANPFRGMFPRSRKRKQQAETEADEDRMASRLQLDLERDTLSRSKSKPVVDKSGSVDVFRGVSFDNWLRMIIQYCFILTQRDQFDLADEILRHLLVSNAYQAQERQDSIRVALITCGIRVRDFTSVVDHCRKLITRHQFNNEPLRLLLASLSSGLRPTDAFITSTLQKHLFRELKLADVAVKNPDALKWNALNKRYAVSTTASGGSVGGSKDDAGDADADGDDDDNDMDASMADASLLMPGVGPSTSSTSGQDKTATIEGRPPIPTEHNPCLVAIYGQICVAAKSYQSGIFYLLHAYDYAPKDPMICLCLAIASVGRAMQRQSDNRHHLIAQGMAFLTQYRNLRNKDPRTAREVEYNFGRIFHQLGLYSYAVKQYERVLEMADSQGDDLYAKEAAYNLSLIFVFTGATPLAETLYRRWLSL